MKKSNQAEFASDVFNITLTGIFAAATIAVFVADTVLGVVTFLGKGVSDILSEDEENKEA